MHSGEAFLKPDFRTSWDTELKITTDGVREGYVFKTLLLNVRYFLIYKTAIKQAAIEMNFKFVIA